MVSKSNVMLSEAERSRSISTAVIILTPEVTTAVEILRLRSASLSMTFFFTHSLPHQLLGPKYIIGGLQKLGAELGIVAGVGS